MFVVFAQADCCLAWFLHRLMGRWVFVVPLWGQFCPVPIDKMSVEVRSSAQWGQKRWRSEEPQGCGGLLLREAPPHNLHNNPTARACAYQESLVQDPYFKHHTHTHLHHIWFQKERRRNAARPNKSHIPCLEWDFCRMGPASHSKCSPLNGFHLCPKMDPTTISTLWPQHLRLASICASMCYHCPIPVTPIPVLSAGGPRSHAPGRTGRQHSWVSTIAHEGTIHRRVTKGCLKISCS